MKIDINNAVRQIQSLLNDLITMLPNLVLGIGLFLVFFLGGKYASGMVRRLSDAAGRARSVGLLLGRAAHYVVVIVGTLIALSIVFPTFKANDLIQVLGIGGVAIGFAFKDIFQNFLAGVIILISRPFRIGDQIVVKGYEGTVEDIQTRATMIRTYDSRLIVIPNTVLFTEEVTVLTAYEHRRNEYDFGLAHGTDLEKARGIIVEAMASVEEVEEHPAPDVIAIGISDGAILIRMRWWASTKVAGLVVKDKVMQRVEAAITAAGINFPQATQTITLQRAKPEVEA